MAEPLVFYTYIPSNWNASFYYRLFVPYHTARDLGLPIRVHVDTDGSVDPQQRMTAFCEADIIQLYQAVSDATLQNLRTAKRFLPSKRDGGWKYPPSVVIDTDDNLFNVNPYNVAYRGLGIRDHEGVDIPPGHMIGVMQNGEKKVLWQDGKDGFDITRNRQTIETYRQIVDMADAVTCSTPHVAACVKADAKPRRVQVFPNLVRFDHYEQVALAQDPARLNILWQGGASHYEDWYPLREALGEITRKYPHVHWTIWGQMYNWVTELIPPDRYTFKNWCPYPEYKLRLAMMNHDINLAPLNNNRFNRCRSAIKFYEGSVLKKPAATLAQATGPYKDEILPGETGLLFETPAEFVAQLSLLIEDATLRKTLASNAKDWVSDNRDAFKQVPKQFAYFEQLRELNRREMPHMPDGQWDKFEAAQRAEQEAAEAAAAAASAEANGQPVEA